MVTLLWIGWGVAALVQGLFWWVGGHRLWRPASPVALLPPEALPPVSVILCARNEAANLQKKLNTILQQDYPVWELLVVDDASTDATPRLLAHYERHYAHLRVLRLTQKKLAGKKGALAAGIAAARYDSLLLTDADCMPASPRWIQRMATQAIHDQATLVLGTGPYVGAPTWRTRWVQYETAYVAAQYSIAACWGMPYMGVGRNLWYTKAAYEAAGGFEAHQHLASGDDDLLVNAIATEQNTTLCLHPESVVYSEVPPTWRALYHQKTRHYSSSSSYRWQHQLALGALSISVVVFYVGMLGLMVVNPWNFLILVPVFGVRLMGQYRVYYRLLQAWQQTDVLPYVILLDALLPLYYAIFALAVLRPQRRPLWERF